jgi:F1F0 ATPase subunit 2
LVLAAVAGLGLGLLLYGGLYFTVTRGLNSQCPALWFVGSLLMRMSLVLTGFYYISGGDWQRLIACLAGLVVTGIIFQVWQNNKNSAKPYAKERRSHAP